MSSEEAHRQKQAIARTQRRVRDASAKNTGSHIGRDGMNRHTGSMSESRMYKLFTMATDIGRERERKRFCALSLELTLGLASTSCQEPDSKTSWAIWLL